MLLELYKHGSVQESWYMLLELYKHGSVQESFLISMHYKS